MKMHFAVKILLSFLITALLLVTGFVFLVIFLFQPGIYFYGPFIITVTLILIIYSILLIFKFHAAKKLTIALVCILGVGVLTAGGYEMQQAYVNSIPTVNEQEINLQQYQPFTPDTKAVRLGEAATLQLQSNLPRLDGATALYPVYAAFVQAVYPEKEYDPYDSEVMGSTTPDAYKNLLSGTVDMIFAAAPSAKQLEAAEQAGVELELTPIGLEAFVFFVNAHNPVQGLSSEQIQAIYSGEITNWREVGGNDESIRAFQRPEGSGSQTMLQKFMEGKDLMEPPKENIVSGMGGIIDRTAAYKNYGNAIGYSFLYYATQMKESGDIRLLEVDGVAPTRETIASGAYPLTAEFYVITAGSDNPHVEEFIAWIRSPQGKKLIELTGYTPIADH